MTLYGGLSISPSANANYSSGSAKASDDGTHMPEYPSTVAVDAGGGNYSDGYTQPKKEQDSSDGTHMPEYPSNVEVSGGGYSDGHATQPKKEQDTALTPEPTPNPPEKLDVSKLLQNQTPPSTFYVDDEGNISNTKDTKDNVYYGENALSPKSLAPKTKKQTATAAMPEVSQIYTMDGDDYAFDTNAFAAAQRGTGEDQAAMSVAGGGGGGSKRNSNVNDAVFGGQSSRANPGYSLW